MDTDGSELEVESVRVATPVLPSKYAKMKQELAKALDTDAFTEAWGDLIDTIKRKATEIVVLGPDVCA